MCSPIEGLLFNQRLSVDQMYVHFSSVKFPSLKKAIKISEKIFPKNSTNQFVFLLAWLNHPSKASFFPEREIPNELGWIYGQTKDVTPRKKRKRKKRET